MNRDDVVLKIVEAMENSGRKVHWLKVWPEYFDAIRSGDKTFELRYDDRDFKTDDILMLSEFDNQANTYTGRRELRRISYKLSDCGMFGLKDGFCVLGLKEIFTA